MTKVITEHGKKLTFDLGSSVEGSHEDGESKSVNIYNYSHVKNHSLLQIYKYVYFILLKFSYFRKKVVHPFLVYHFNMITVTYCIELVVFSNADQWSQEYN